MKNSKLFRFDFLSLYTLVVLFLLGYSINSLIDVIYGSSTSETLFRVSLEILTALSLSVYGIIALRKKRMTEISK